MNFRQGVWVVFVHFGIIGAEFRHSVSMSSREQSFHYLRRWKHHEEAKGSHLDSALSFFDEFWFDLSTTKWAVTLSGVAYTSSRWSIFACHIDSHNRLQGLSGQDIPMQCIGIDLGIIIPSLGLLFFVEARIGLV